LPRPLPGPDDLGIAAAGLLLLRFGIRILLAGIKLIVILLLRLAK
jgi:hypothetical protein